MAVALRYLLSSGHCSFIVHLSAEILAQLQTCVMIEQYDEHTFLIPMDKTLLLFFYCCYHVHCKLYAQFVSTTCSRN